MKLNEFVKQFIEPNSIIRLVYKIKGGHEVVLNNFSDVSMSWEILKKEGKYRKFSDNEVIGIASIMSDKEVTAINIVIEHKPMTFDELIYKMSKDKSEGSLYHSWQANIAVAMQDEFLESKDKGDIYKITNNGAKRFLDLLTNRYGGENNMKNEKTFLVSKRNILSEVAKWAVAQSPYHRPENLEIVLDKLNKEIGEWKDNLGYKYFFYKELKNCLKEWLFNIPEFILWNDRKNGNQSPYKITDRYSKEDNPDDDFIDLDALIRNVANSIIREGKEISIPEILGEGKLKSTN